MLSRWPIAEQSQMLVSSVENWFTLRLGACSCWVPGEPLQSIWWLLILVAREAICSPCLWRNLFRQAAQSFCHCHSMQCLACQCEVYIAPDSSDGPIRPFSRSCSQAMPVKQYDCLSLLDAADYLQSIPCLGPSPYMASEGAMPSCHRFPPSACSPLQMLLLPQTFCECSSVALPPRFCSRVPAFRSRGSQQAVIASVFQKSRTSTLFAPELFRLRVAKLVHRHLLQIPPGYLQRSKSHEAVVDISESGTP